MKDKNKRKKLGALEISAIALGRIAMSILAYKVFIGI